MSTTIGNYNVSLGLNVADLVDGSKLARNETAAVVRSLKSLVTPAEDVARKLDLMEKAFKDGAIEEGVYQEASRRLTGSLQENTSAVNANAEALRRDNALISEGERLTRQLMTTEEQHAQEIRRIDQLNRAGAIGTTTRNRALADLSRRQYENSDAGIRMNRAVADGEALTRRMLTTQERYRQELQRVNELFRMGTISGTTRSRAVADLDKQLSGSKGGFGIGGQLAGLAASYLGVHAAVNLATNSIRKSADVERAAASYEVLTGSVGQAKDIMSGIRDITSHGISFSALSQAAQTMLSFNIASQDVLPALRQISEITGGDAEKIKRMSIAFSQVSSNGRLMAEELNQLIEAGFNPLQEISRTTGRSILDLRKDMKDGLISFEMVKDAFESVTSSGGRFNGMLDRISETTAGSLNSVSAHFETFQIELGDALSPLVKMVAKDFTEASGSASEFAGSVSSISLAAAGLSEELKSLTGQGLTDFLTKFNGVAITLKGFALPLDLMRSIGLTSGSVGVDDKSRKIRMEASQRVRQSLGDSMFSPESIKMIDDYFEKMKQGTEAAKTAEETTKAIETQQKAAAAASAQDPTTKKYNTQVITLQSQIEKLKAGKAAAAGMKAELQGMSDAQKTHITNLSKQVELLEKQAKATKKEATEREQMHRQADSILKKSGTAQQEFAIEAEKISKLQKAGMINPAQARNALDEAFRTATKAGDTLRKNMMTPMEKVAREFDDIRRLLNRGDITTAEAMKARTFAVNKTFDDLKITTPNSMEVGSAEAFKYLADQKNERITEQMKLALEQKLLSQQQLREQQETNRLMRALADVSPRRAS